MSQPSESTSPAGQPRRESIAPFLKAIQARDMEALSKLRHALRTPLNQILGYCEMMMESSAEEGYGAILGDLKRIHASGGQLLALINDALAPWKIETGKLDIASLRRDMDQPLNVVIGCTELCLEECKAAGREALAADLSKIHRAALHLHGLFEEDEFTRHFSLTPFSPEEAVAPATPTQAPPLMSSVPEGGSAQPLVGQALPARLLVVDDDAMNRDMLVRRLKKLGHFVTEAANGRIALQKLKEDNFDLVLLDIIMPELDGFHTLEFMKADQRLRHLPVIMLTALDDVESTVRCIEAGAEDFVPKPFNPVVLRARISASLEKKRLRDQEQAYLTQLQSERAKSERLLLNVLPRAVADRLKAGERTIVDSFREATVIFADIVGFTRIAGRQSPSRTVQLLNDLFSNFDRVAEQFQIEKIKTIGDSYMVVSGLPINNPDHAEIAANAAFELLEALRQFNRRHRLDWQIRIGMNCGPVVAGIIGTKKFSYDLWGDTVNIAARMESYGQPDKIQVSSNIRRELSGKFEFESVGLIEIKNVGPMETYFLHRKQ